MKDSRYAEETKFHRKSKSWALGSTMSHAGPAPFTHFTAAWPRPLNIAFKILKLEPQLRNVIINFYESKNGKCLKQLEVMKDNLKLDIYLATPPFPNTFGQATPPPHFTQKT